MIKQFIQSVRDEKDGFSFDKPWRLEEKSIGVIIPILRKSKKKRDYITLSEAKDVKIEDTGQIDGVYVKNNEDKPLLICRGEIFRGKTQERAAIHDYMVMPGKGLRVAVRCIHQSKGISSKAPMESSGRAAYSITFDNQQKTWESVRTYATVVSDYVGVGTSNPTQPINTTNLRGNSIYTDSINVGASGDIPLNSWYIAGGDDLVGTIDALSDSIREVMKKIPFIDNQVGAAFFKENNLIGMDVYDLPDSWDAVKKDVTEKEGATFLEKDSDDMFDFKPEKAHKLLKKKLDIDFEEKTIYQDKDYTLTELRSDSLLGEAITYKDNVIHLTLWQKQ